MESLRNILKKILYKNGVFDLYYKIDFLSDSELIEVVSKVLNNLYEEE